MADFRVFEVAGGGWHVKGCGERFARSRHASEDDAVAAAMILIAGSGGGELVVEGRGARAPEHRTIEAEKVSVDPRAVAGLEA